MRTEEMHLVAEAGVAAHWLYKQQDADGAAAERLGTKWLQSLLDIQNETRDAAEFWDHVKVDLFPDAVYVFTPKGQILALPRGATVNMSSVNGVLAIPTIASYNVSKGGINQLTRVMALALADKGIRVNAVAPGTIATALAEKAVLTSDEARTKIMSRTPMRRLGLPEEVADVVAWLASDAASYVTGEIVTVDGGRMTLNYTVPV